MLIHKIGCNSNNYFPKKDISFNGKLSDKIFSKKSPSTKPNDLTPYCNYGIDYFTKRTQNVQTAINNKINEKIGEIRITKLFTSNGIPLSEIVQNKNFIKKLANLDYKNVEEKYLYYKKEIQKYTPEYNHNKIGPMVGILDFEELTKEDLDTIHSMAKSAYKKHSKWNKVISSSEMYYYITTNLKNIKDYENFEILSTLEQRSFIGTGTYYLDDEFINNLKDNDSLMKFGLIKDMKRCGSSKLLLAELSEKMRNKPVSSINVNPQQMKDFVESDYLNIESLKNTIGNIDLNKYEKGLPLKYSRDNFISDFNNEIKNLSLKEKNEIFKYYQFSIDSENDIIKFPVPTNADTSSLSPKVQEIIPKTNKYINDFVLNNKIILDKQDKEAEEFLNKFITVFPEFISVIGKIQHRGDSIDHHTLDNLQRCINNPEIQKLTKEEQRILFFSVMFHDIAKKQKLVDEGHQRPSSIYAKEIIKKVPISFKEKEQIYNLIANSHWLTDGKTASDLGAIFRHNNEFLIAQIMSKADSESSGFEYTPSEKQINLTEEKINEIQSAGIPLFADNLPDDTSKFPTDKDGVKYLDFTDKEADLSVYGFREGTKVKDLNLLSHNASSSFSSLADICDDSKEICLSTSLLNASGDICTHYNQPYSYETCDVILYSSNSDIALAGINVGCTGGKRGFEHFKDYVYGESICFPNEKRRDEQNIEQRNELPNYIKNELNLSDSEYLELYRHLENYSDKRDIQSVTLSSGRTINSKTIKHTLNKMHKYLLEDGKNNMDYNNEIVIFQPKIQAVVMSKKSFMKSDIKDSELKQTAKNNDIPVILV